MLLLWLPLLCLAALQGARAQVLNPPYFNIAEGRKIRASATCGERVSEAELYCKLVGANTDKQENPNINLIQGQLCDFCDPKDPKRAHPPENAIDGSEKWWQSPPLSRGNEYNEVNLTIDLGQEFHVAYVFIKMGNSPRPGVWVLERSKDNGMTYSPWYYFADSPGDCVQHFGAESLRPLVSDDSVICETKFSKVVPLEGGEIVVSLLNDRPNADNFSYSTVLQEWTKATNISLRFLRTKTLLGHLMSVARQDPTVTRRYFYSIKDINIGGRCVCNGHAETCDLTEHKDPYRLLCRCEHHTCGPQCERCCPGFEQKKWRRAIIDSPFVCEPCNCFGHSDECIYDEEVERKRLSLDISGHYEGGGVCQNCWHNTEGINCNHCKPTFYRPYGKLLNATDVCQPCNCDPAFSTGNCADGSGQCECRPEFLPPYCDNCNVGYYGYPECRLCDCHSNGTLNNVCEVGGGQCPCKPYYDGKNCDRCKEGYYGFPHTECTPCNCNPATSVKNVCDEDDGQCVCRGNYGGRQCDRCRVGFYSYPTCEYCACDPTGTVEEICDSTSGECLCKQGYGGPKCDRCSSGYFGYPLCEECQCSEYGSLSSICDISGRCHCLSNYAGLKCDQCSPGYYNFSDCYACNCDSVGSIGVSCNDEGKCVCKENFDSEKCNECKEGFYNYPYCEECNCNPAGVLPTFLGCGSLTTGNLCECKERVTGRICHQCKPLYWNLKIANPLGCEECDCFLGGTVGGIAVCERTTGKCTCKPNVGSRQCSQCKDGSYELNDDDLFGCKDCGCDVGGSVNNICDKHSGQCACRPRISGRKCDQPLQTHYFPTLFQHQFEIEDGRTPAGTAVRYGYDESVFPGFSWRGYAVFSDIQREVLLDIFVEKPSLYQIFFYYLNFGGDNIYGTITFTPETFGDIQQSSDMVFEASSTPRFMKVSGKQGLLASPFVLNPGKWTVSIRIEKPMFLDYMVLLPQSYYEATLLQEDVTAPCTIHSEDHELCIDFRYPPLPAQSHVTKGEHGYVYDGEERSPTHVYEDVTVLDKLHVGRMAWLDVEQQSLQLDFTVAQPGLHVMIISYHTPRGADGARATIELTSDTRTESGTAVFYECQYSFPCRQVVVDAHGEVAHFDVEFDFAKAVLETSESANLAVESVALVPADFWDLDYIQPESRCIRRDGSCLESVYLPIPETTKIEFESGDNENLKSSVLPEGILDPEIGLINLEEHDNVVDLNVNVPSAGAYVFVINYYQPNHPSFDAKVVIHDGEFFEAVLPLQYCPSVSGCRTTIHAKDTGATAFHIMESFSMSIKQPANKSVWVDYLLVIPAKQFRENVLQPLPQDKAGKFITGCGQNSFFLQDDASEFCREAVFSLTSEYNNGALSCQCDTDGSLSYECEEFGGQCTCRANVIGRTCSQCRTGFFGFPNCKPCDCPSTAYCHPVTGQCICPPRVTGDKCDVCVPYTYGFDSIIGCEECNCSHLGVYQGILQCDLQTGQCRCKSNIVGRTCDKCKAGYWAFPHCQLCNCDLRGTTEDICEQASARCFCKENVYGDSCDQCKPGTFYLEEVNPLGCTKCFCFGTTDRCSSAYFFRTQISDLQNWSTVAVDLETGLNEIVTYKKDVSLIEREAGEEIEVFLTDLPSKSLLYFSAPHSYLGNKLFSYGGNLTYTILTAIDSDENVETFVGPDVVLMGNNITILHDHIEQPAAGLPFKVNINLIEREFHHVSGREVTREQMMMVLVNLERLLIRGLYFHPAIEIRLLGVLMDTAVESYVADAPQALRVEQCQCPPSYRGTSCEECAAGYYRSKTGPYLGYCVPCECHGHAQTCDANTGTCIGCQHNTFGDHCGKCLAGYHGDATQGTPYDCLICACPLPIESNNFAESCEVSQSGLEISCNCKPGYYGVRCDVCDIGYYGSPEVLGGRCQRCQCSGNIDPGRPGSCDSVTGDCILCLNNTFGAACELCAPGYYGDAVSRKDCTKCNCDECGTRRCDHGSGTCTCWPNVEGPSCDRCIQNYWGFKGCSGCRACNCGPASSGEQCDIETGKCSCHPGADGITCDVCAPGYWQYSSRGCISCNCDEKYSAGAVCNPVTGQCQCLPGVLGDKCDSCPYRWVFVKNEGCLECGPCVHGLLDTTDFLHEMIEPVMEEMKAVSLSYFANKRLQNVNKTADSLRLGIEELLSASDLDYSPLVYEVHTLEKKKDELDRMATHSHAQAVNIASDADTTRMEALEMQKLIYATIAKVKGIVDELDKLSEALSKSIGPNLDNLIHQAEYILENLKHKDFESPANSTDGEYEACAMLLDRVKAFGLPALENKDYFDKLNNKTLEIMELLDDLREHSQNASVVAYDAQLLQGEIRRIPVKGNINEIERLSDEIEDVLQNSSLLLKLAQDFLNASEHSYAALTRDADQLLLSIRNLKDHISETQEKLNEMGPLIDEATDHAEFLKGQAELLDRSLADTRDSADAAVKAANAYGNIGEAIDDALIAAQSARSASDQAESMSDGVLGKTNASKEHTSQLYDTASELEQHVKDLEPQLGAAKEGVVLVAEQNGKTARGLDIIKKDLNKLPLHSLGVLAGHAANGSAVADEIAEKARSKIQDIVSRLPEDEVTAEQIPEDIEHVRQDVKAAHSYVDRISSITPDTNVLMDRASKRETAMRIIGTDVSEKLMKLQKKIAIARTLANRIKLGVQFFENTTLQLRNPEAIHRAATYTRMSLYFKTTERYGFLTYIGNEKGSHNHMKRVLTDDFLALEIKGGRLVMTMDLGSGSQEIRHDSYVSDGKWHQAIIERTGKACTLTVRTQDEEDVVVEGSLPGTYSVFNLDQKISKFFVGGVSDTAVLQDAVENRHFDGCIEEVEFGETPMGLWDFVDAENNFEGCAERDELAVLVPSNGLRFSGSGYVILPRKRHNFTSETHTKMLFKTYAKDGLLFLVGKNGKFLALELKDGRVTLKYNLGSSTVLISSDETYNDGEWHSLEAAREGKEAILKLDKVEVGSAIYPGEEKSLTVTNQIFVGGHPGKHSFADVTNLGFEGCIMDMQISAEIIDLNKNKEALGVVNGCPVTIARTVSFSNVSTGYVAMPTANLEGQAELTFKFKTAEENGLIFYAANEDQTSHLLVALHDGALLMKSTPGGEIRTHPDVKYNDREWHYVSATKALRRMRLDIDDINSVEIDATEDAVVHTTTPVYFGGVPDDYIIDPDVFPDYVPFVGCIGDTTVNNRFQNFADTQDRQAASLASCPLGAPDEHPTPPSPIDATSSTESSHTAPVDEESTTPQPDFPEPTPMGSCALPLYPRTDTSVKSGDGVRFGNTPTSRQEFSRPTTFTITILEDSTFALEFRTFLNSGVMFYVAGGKHIDFVGLLMQDGKVIYVFNCGTGTAIISSQNAYNDGTWHRTVFSRRGQKGRLVIDDEEEVRGTSLGSANSVNVREPFFIGGLPEDVAREAKNNLKGMTLSFPGCIRNVETQGELLTAKKPSLEQNVTGCSDKVEEGIFFSADGGHVILYDKYRVGQRVSITLDIKPRNLSGILMAVHGRTDYLILQMVDGQIVFSVDNGAGAIKSTYFPPDEHYLCDGEWHTIQVVKTSNVVTLTVDSVASEPGIGVGGVSSTDTNDPLYIGGIPNPGTSRGVETEDQFVGCMRYLELDSRPRSFSQSRVVGHVTLNTCSTI